MWQLFYGSATDSEATVYARWLGAPSDLDPSSRLTLQGPFCAVSRTLRASFVMRRESERLWQTTVLDPCFWSAELPARYGLKIDDQRTRAAEVGIRRFGARGASLYLNGRRWVFRAIDARGTPEIAVPLIRESMLSVITTGHDEPFAAAASERGVMLAISAESYDPSAITRWSRWPAVAMLVLPWTTDMDRDHGRGVAPNLLVGCEVTTSAETFPTWADFYVAPNDAATLRRLRSERPDQPVMACVASPEGWENAGAARRDCERLQASLAPEFDLSGYVARLG